jgi:hypothetical protein
MCVSNAVLCVRSFTVGLKYTPPVSYFQTNIVENTESGTNFLPGLYMLLGTVYMFSLAEGAPREPGAGFVTSALYSICASYAGSRL